MATDPIIEARDWVPQGRRACRVDVIIVLLESESKISLCRMNIKRKVFRECHLLVYFQMLISFQLSVQEEEWKII